MAGKDTLDILNETLRDLRNTTDRRLDETLGRVRRTTDTRLGDTLDGLRRTTDTRLGAARASAAQQFDTARDRINTGELRTRRTADPNTQTHGTVMTGLPMADFAEMTGRLVVIGYTENKMFKSPYRYTLRDTMTGELYNTMPDFRLFKIGQTYVSIKEQLRGKNFEI